MNSSNSALVRVLRGHAVGPSPEVLNLKAPQASRSARVTSLDPFAAERAAAYQEGYDAAMAEVASRDESAKAARAERLTDALLAGAAEASEHREFAVAQAAREAIDLAFELAETLLGHEVVVRGSLTAEAIARALALAPRDEDLVVRMHPDDAITPAEVQALAGDASVRVVSDPSVEAGGCVVEAGPCRIDAQTGAALARARALIGSEHDGASS